MSGWNGVAPGGGAMTGGGNDEWVEHKVGVLQFRKFSSKMFLTLEKGPKRSDLLLQQAHAKVGVGKARVVDDGR